MIALKLLLMILGGGLFGTAAVIVAYDVYAAARLRWLLGQAAGEGTAAIEPRPFGPVRWELARNLILLGMVPILLALAIAVVPDGFAGIRVSQLSGVRPASRLKPALFDAQRLANDVLCFRRSAKFPTESPGKISRHCS